MENTYVIILFSIILIAFLITSLFVYKLSIRTSRLHSILSVESLKFDKLDYKNTKEKVNEMHSVMMMIKCVKFLEEIKNNNEEE